MLTTWLRRIQRTALAIVHVRSRKNENEKKLFVMKLQIWNLLSKFAKAVNFPYQFNKPSEKDADSPCVHLPETECAEPFHHNSSSV